MEQLLLQIQDIFLSIIKFDNHLLMTTLGKPEIMVAAFIALNIIVFTETGLLIGFFLPGDSLLVTAGIVAWASDWPLHWLIPTLCLSAVIGDTVGYLIGFRVGPRLFNKEKSFFFRKDYLLAAQHFYEKHGGKTIIIARFMPIVRTFAPVVAGIGQMCYRRFLAFNVIGGISWVVSMILLGYFLTPAIDPPMKRLFGAEFEVKKHIEKVIVLVVFISIAPGIYAGAKGWLAKRKGTVASQATAKEPVKSTPAV